MKIIHSLGVEASPAKTHKSKDLYEFAKRLFYRGEEITPFPISAISESVKRSYLLTTLFKTEMVTKS